MKILLRSETKPKEERAALTPDGARRLREAGYEVSVERSELRVFKDSEYEAVGCELVDAGSWRKAPKETVILGLKELPEARYPLTHRHIYFAHAYKNQQGWKTTLGRFGAGQGTLLDLEYLVDDTGRRVAAFGYWAGYVGAAVGVLAWAHRRLRGADPIPELRSWPSKEALLETLRPMVAQAVARGGEPPTALVVGARGRCGRGACDLLEALGLATTRWDLEETRKGGPFSEILEHDLFVNCVLVQSELPPFLTRETIAGARRLSVIADVSCDPNGPYNPIPIYSATTDFANPTVEAAPGLEVVAIDHLPSLLPRESSEDFGEQLLPHLLALVDGSPVWERAEKLFFQKKELAQGTIHWLGAGLSSGPGIRRTASLGKPMVLWNRTVAKAHEALRGEKHVHVEVKAFDLAALGEALEPGDVVVSMLPAPMHPEIATLCLDKGAHFVSTSYVSDAMRALHERARARRLSFVNEAGLDPGLDHMMAHLLVEDYRRSPAYSPEHVVSFRSYCGGFPKVPNEFRYKFSWSPVGVLRALKSQARSIAGGREVTVPQVWKGVKPFHCRGEEFESYPNRDSVPYVQEYGLDPTWKLDEFVRGTLRLQGWSARWKDLFAEIQTADEARLQALGDELWSKYAYGKDDPDRVVLSVELEARARDGSAAFHQKLILDEAGTTDRTAMGYLVSIPASFAVEEVLGGRAPAGVSGAPRDRATIERWLAALVRDGVLIHRD